MTEVFVEQPLALPGSAKKCCRFEIREKINGQIVKFINIEATMSDESDKIVCGFLEPPWCNKNIDPERFGSWGSKKIL